ncbi:hypothetical protein MMC29_006256, partial [Sticta canariensis]|nr:hypothetical protein [Sticta canariensis]
MRGQVIINAGSLVRVARFHSTFYLTEINGDFSGISQKPREGLSAAAKLQWAGSLEEPGSKYGLDPAELSDAYIIKAEGSFFA